MIDASYLGNITSISSMTELDLLNLARSVREGSNSEFAQIITITFAMVVAIYYFLHQAGPRMKIFAFVIYTFGMFMYFGLMVEDANFATGVLRALQQIPLASQSPPTQSVLAVKASWVGTTVTVLLNSVYWVLWIGTSYLLFFWKKPGEQAKDRISEP
ncbi:MAG: hypothetical protein ABI233_04685 [Chthoniobacterales bacterium]